MSGHRRYRRRRSSESWSPGTRSITRSSMRASNTDDDVHGGDHRRLKQSSDPLPVWGSPASHHSWVLLNRSGARRHGFPDDPTMSATSRTSRGEEISVSFELAEPPGTSILTFDWQLWPSTTPRKSMAKVIAAHRDIVLLAMTSYEDAYRSKSSVTDLFVYQARSRDLDPSQRRRPSLLLLQLASTGGPVIYPHRLDNGGIGIMSCTSNDAEEPSAFVVAELQISWTGKSDVRLFRSRSGQWETFQDLHVHGGEDLCWWSTDAVVPYGRRCMIWVDYYRGIVLMDMSSSRLQTRTNPLPPPRLRYVPLPVDKVGDPEDYEYGGRGCPKDCRAVCVTRYGVKFVSIDSQHFSNFGVGSRDLLKWSQRFRITTWSLREDDTWRKDVTMHEEEFWDAFDGGGRFPFPHVQPSFPVVDADNPDVAVFRLEEPYYPDDTKWMIEVDLRKKVLLAATAYSNKGSDGLSADAQAINSARVSCFDPVPSELPRYLDGAHASQASKKRRR